MDVDDTTTPPIAGLCPKLSDRAYQPDPGQTARRDAGGAGRFESTGQYGHGMEHDANAGRCESMGQSAPGDPG